jgi:ATP-dependent 26S proteasome regulatory subunit
MTDRIRLEQLILARHPCLVVTTSDENYVLTLLREIGVEAGREVWQWTVTDGLRDAMLTNTPQVPQTDHPAAAMYHLIRNVNGPVLCAMLDLPGHLKDERTLRVLREAIDQMERIGGMLVLIHTNGELPPAISSVATVFDISFPDKTELEKILRDTVREIAAGRQIQVNLSKQGLSSIVRNLQGLNRRQAKRVLIDAICDDCRLDESDVNKVLVGKRQALAGAGILQYVESPVDLNEVGGLARLKEWVLQRKPAMESDDAIQFGLTPPRGLLMLGVQGAGKSLAAKAVATAGQLPLLRMDVGSLYDQYVGQSEKRLRDALRQAEMMSPVVLWIDEIEKAFASAASESTDGGLSRRMFGALLTWMQERTAPVFLIATANDIDALPPELLRKGRFDEIFFVDLPTLEARTQIVQIHLKKRKRDPAKFDIAAIADACDGYSGAEIEQGIVSALYDAYKARRDLTTADILGALKGSPPLSVTMAERVAALREWAADRCVPAD